MSRIGILFVGCLILSGQARAQSESPAPAGFGLMAELALEGELRDIAVGA